MRLGAHQSIAGGLERSVEAARRDGCESLQIFSRNQSQWKAKPLTDESIERFRTAVRDWGVPRECLMVHDSYLVNLAAADAALRKKSLAAFTHELERCSALGIPYLVMHPGAHVGQGEAKGLWRVSQAITRALAKTHDGPEPTTILIELTAGQGTCLGHRFEHIRDLLASIDPLDRVGVCVDTCHVFAAGYDISTDEGYEETFKAMDRTFGLHKVRAFHLNDAKKPLGSRVDRHEGIGDGHIGRTPFRRLMNDRRFADLPGVLELPPPYPPMLQRLRRMSDGRATARRRPRVPRTTAIRR